MRDLLTYAVVVALVAGITLSAVVIAGVGVMPDVTPKEIEAAKAWRFRRNLTMRELGELIGYSESKISWVERGLSPPRHGRWDGHTRTSKPTPVTSSTWQRYKKLCELADLKLRHPDTKEFTW